MEGWDCSFAYVLGDAGQYAGAARHHAVGGPSDETASRPSHGAAGRWTNATYTAGILTWGVAVQQVKQGLEQEGLTGLGDDVWSSGGASQLFSCAETRAVQGPGHLPAQGAAQGQ